MIVPLGRSCKTAYQVSTFLKTHGINGASFPYDWTITPFAALEATLDQAFDPSTALQSLERSRFGSITDSDTRLIHHHDFDPPSMQALEVKTDAGGVPKALYTTDLITRAQGRFMHTFAHVASLKQHAGKILFVRWHPDDGETIDDLGHVLHGFLSHDNFAILQIRSTIIEKALPGTVITDYRRSRFGVEASIIERKGFDGDGTENFKGDTVVWRTLLQKFVDEEGYRFEAGS